MFETTVRTANKQINKDIDIQ